MNTYYHVLEHGRNYEIAWHGCYEDLNAAQSEADRLKSFWPELYFEIWPSAFQHEPEIVTV